MNGTDDCAQAHELIHQDLQTHLTDQTIHPPLPRLLRHRAQHGQGILPALRRRHTQARKLLNQLARRLQTAFGQELPIQQTWRQVQHPEADRGDGKYEVEWYR